MFKSANVGNADRIVRLLLGALLITLPMVTTTSVWENPVARWGAPLVGLVLIATAVVRFCPLYRLVGASTCNVGSSSS